MRRKSPFPSPLKLEVELFERNGGAIVLRARVNERFFAAEMAKERRLVHACQFGDFARRRTAPSLFRKERAGGG